MRENVSWQQSVLTRSNALLNDAGSLWFSSPGPCGCKNVTNDVKSEENDQSSGSGGGVTKALICQCPEEHQHATLPQALMIRHNRTLLNLPCFPLLHLEDDKTTGFHQHQTNSPGYFSENADNRHFRDNLIFHEQMKTNAPAGS